MGNKSRGYSKLDEKAFTLVELAVVVVLVALVSVFAANKLTLVSYWKEQSDIRRFLNTWELLYTHALSQRDGYRLIVDINNNTYYVRRELPPDRAQVKNVDYLQNLRLDSEKKRRQKKNDRYEDELAREFDAADQPLFGSLEEQYYQTVFLDPEHEVRLAIPLDFPKLGEKVQLGAVSIRGIQLGKTLISEGEVAIRFNSSGIGEMAMVSFERHDGTILRFALDPNQGRAFAVNEEFMKGLLKG